MATVPMKVFGVLLFALCLVVPLISATATEVEYCNKNYNYIVKVNGLDINPYPVIPNKEATFAMSATTAEPISGGKLEIDVSYLGILVRKEVHDLCEETICPIAVGDFKVYHSLSLPGFTPTGSYTMKMSMVDGNYNQLTCINFRFKVVLLAEESLAVM